MGWGTDAHEGWADENWPDGSWSGSTHRGGDLDAVAYQAVCSCGWRSAREHPVASPPCDAPRDQRGMRYGRAWDAWIETREAANDACWDDWSAEHFDPLLGYEPHTQLIEAADEGGGRHFLDGRAVHAGATLELLLGDGHWVAGRYEWSSQAGGRASFHVGLGGPAEAERQAVTPAVSFEPPAGSAALAHRPGARPMTSALPVGAAAAKRAKGAALAEHVRRLADAHDVVVDERASARGRAWRGQRRVRVPPVRGVTSYLVALHELAHVVGSGRSRRRLEQEVAAWRWALAQTIVSPTPGARRAIFRALWSYVAWAQARQHRTHARPVIPPADNDLWRMLENLAASADERGLVRAARAGASR
jgi:hypothetical protein